MKIKTKAATPNSELDQRIRDALSSAKMALWEFDLKKGIVEWTGKVTKHFYDFAQSFDGTITQYLNLIHPDDSGHVLDIISKSAKDGGTFFNQHRIKWPDGTYHWVEGMGNVLKSGDSIKLTGTVQDITERRQVEIERTDWQKRYQLVANSVDILTYLYDHNTKMIQWSENTEPLFGYHPNEIEDIDDWEKNIHPDDLQYTQDEFERAENQLDVYDINYRFKDKYGNYMHIHDKGIFIGNGKMLGIILDITDIKQAEQALKESRSRFKSMIHDMNIGVGLYDKTTKPLLCNRMAFELLGLTEGQFMGKAALDPNWKIIHNDGAPFDQEDFPIPISIKTGKPVRQTIMGVHRPSKKDMVWLLVDAEPVFNSEGRLLHVICTYSDITEQRKAQDALNEKNKILTTLANELRGKNERLLEFAQIVSHNLRSPISSIVSLLEIYKKGDSSRAEIIQHIDGVSSKALKTIEELNEVLKIQQEDNVIPQWVDFNEHLQHAISVQKGAIMESEAKIIADFEVRKVLYSPIYLESIMLNLLSNSLKYRSKERRCEVSVRSYLDGENNLILEWKDNGLGLDVREHKKDLFKLGKRFHSNEDSRGVGLFLIKNQINAMGGTIGVESEVGAWTKFIINIGTK